MGFNCEYVCSLQFLVIYERERRDTEEKEGKKKCKYFALNTDSKKVFGFLNHLLKNPKKIFLKETEENIRYNTIQYTTLQQGECP